MILDLGFDSEIACGAALVLAVAFIAGIVVWAERSTAAPGQINPAKTAAETSMISMSEIHPWGW